MSKKRLTLNNRKPSLSVEAQDFDNVNTNTINKLEDNADGSTTYEIGDTDPKKVDDDKFESNLALSIDDDVLKKISIYILDCLDEDIEARQPWLDIHDTMKKYMGHDLEDATNAPFKQACRAYDTTLSTAAIRFSATATPELLPTGGPCGHKIFGQTTPELEEVALIRAQWLNYYLTVKDSGFYKDYEKSIYYTGFYGTMIRKVYYDKVLRQPISRFISPENFLLNIDCTSILDSDRLTHILKLSSREVLTLQKQGIYRNVKLPYLRTINTATDDNDDSNADRKSKDNKLSNTDAYTNRTLHDVYESHLYLDIDSFKDNGDSEIITEISRPYIVTLDKSSKEILSIRRNWKKDDKVFSRIKYFIGYQYMTGLDIWGLGLARIAGSNAIAVTNILRQTIDAGTYQNLPAGFIASNATKQQKTDIVLGPSQWHVLDGGTGGRPLSDMFASFPANGPSPGLMDLRQGIIGQMQDQLSTAELGMMESKEDVPTGTAVAFLEEKNKIQSSVLKGLHASFSEELKLLDDIFKEVIEKEEFTINGKNHIISKEHFVDSIQIVPVSDPSVNSSIQKIMRAEAVFQTAMQMPEKVNMIELLKIIFKAQGLSEELIESLIIADAEEEVLPADPITENMNMMQDKPVKAGLYQNHDAHMVVHSDLESEQSKAHIQEHMAMKFLIEMQNIMGVNLNEIDLNDPEVQNELALKAAQAVGQLKLNSGEGDNSELDPNQLYAMDIHQKEEANKVKKEIAIMKQEGEAFKSQLHFEETKQRLKVEKEKMMANARIEMEKLRGR